MQEQTSDIEKDDIAYILEHPWEVSEYEWQLGEQTTFDETIAYIQGRLIASSNDGFYRIWRTDSDEPIAILGFFKAGHKAYETFFIASKHMDTYARQISVTLKRLLQEKDAVYKGCKCYLYSGSDHSKQIQWFKFIGFDYFPENNRGITKYFEYRSSYK